jgi:ADP-heptose:LPS heptosyltransferase
MLISASVASDRPLVIVHPGGGVNPGMSLASKRWPTDRIADLTRRVADSTNGVIIVIGSESDKPSTQAVIETLQAHTPVVDLTGSLTLPQIAALAGLPTVALYIGNDTGTAHLAAAAGARTLMIFGPSDPRRYAPFVPPEQAAYAWRPVSVPDRGVAAGGMTGFDWERDGVTVAEAWVQAQRLLERR